MESRAGSVPEVEGYVDSSIFASESSNSARSRPIGSTDLYPSVTPSNNRCSRSVTLAVVRLQKEWLSQVVQSFTSRFSLCSCAPASYISGEPGLDLADAISEMSLDDFSRWSVQAREVIASIAKGARFPSQRDCDRCHALNMKRYASLLTWIVSCADDKQLQDQMHSVCTALKKQSTWMLYILRAGYTARILEPLTPHEALAVWETYSQRVSSTASSTKYQGNSTRSTERD